MRIAINAAFEDFLLEARGSFLIADLPVELQPRFARHAAAQPFQYGVQKIVSAEEESANYIRAEALKRGYAV